MDAVILEQELALEDKAWGETPGESGLITEENFYFFYPLLLPRVSEAIENGEPVTALGWVVNGVACGALAGYLEDDHFEIVSFYVSPSYRNKGIGTRLLDELSELLVGSAYSLRIIFSCTESDHEMLERFLYRRHFSYLSQNRYNMYQTRLGDADRAGVLEKLPISDSIRSFAETENRLLLKEEERARENFQPLPEGGFLKETVDRDISVVYEENGEYTAYITVEQKDRALVVTGADNHSGKPQIFMMLLRGAIDRSLKKYGENEELILPLTDDTAESIVQKVFPNARQIMRVMERTVW
ncbi:MAG: GNAT family N-acetyltransferase [Lachnospiraceae bacterium]|nr:GNAT family N-acetyltransferase [Lachnospiraceae bacterium]